MHFSYLQSNLTLRILLLSVATAMSAHAGNIGFSISFTGDDITITNTGSEPAYQLSEWTLDTTSQWRKTQVLEGNPAYLAPGRALKSRRQTSAAPKGIDQADPMLLLLHDQAGSPITQLAWRRMPAAPVTPLSFERHGTQLRVNAAAESAAIASTYAIVVPYNGIAQLAQPYTEVTAPPRLLQHAWNSATPLLLETGQGQSGAWLVHETAAGELRLQIVPDAVQRGQEQKPGWLRWAQQHLLPWSAALAGIGLLWLVLGSWLSGKRPRQPANP